MTLYDNSFNFIFQWRSLSNFSMYRIQGHIVYKNPKKTAADIVNESRLGNIADINLFTVTRKLYYAELFARESR